MGAVVLVSEEVLTVANKSVLRRLSVQLFREDGSISCPKCAAYADRVLDDSVAEDMDFGVDVERLQRWKVATYHMNHA